MLWFSEVLIRGCLKVDRMMLWIVNKGIAFHEWELARVLKQRRKKQGEETDEP